MSDKKKVARSELPNGRRARPENSRRAARSGRLASDAAPPVAARKPHSFTYHGITVEDSYHWLKDPAYPEVKDADVLGYLEAENAYFESTMKPHQALIDQIFEELMNYERPFPTEGGANGCCVAFTVAVCNRHHVSFFVCPSDTGSFCTGGLYGDKICQNRR